MSARTAAEGTVEHGTRAGDAAKSSGLPPASDPTNIEFYASHLEQGTRIRAQRIQEFLSSVLEKPTVLNSLASNEQLFTGIVTVAMKEFGITQKALADKTDVSIAAVGKWLPAEPSAAAADSDKEKATRKGGAVPPRGYRQLVVKAITDLLFTELEETQAALRASESWKKPTNSEKPEMKPIFYRFRR